MKSRIARNLLWLLCPLFVSTLTKAQFTSKYSIGVNVGTLIYYGDLTPSKTGSWKTPGFVWGVMGHRHLNSTFSGRLEINFGKLRGDEAKYSSPEYRQYRAFAFTNRISEAILAAEWSPLGRKGKLSPYLHGGIGHASTSIVRDYSRFDATYFIGEPSLKETLDRDITVSLPRGVLIVPVGLGLKYTLNNNFSFHAEASQRFTRSDYIDGFSYSGNPDKKDGYSNISFGLRYSIRNKNPLSCPPTRY